MEMMTEHQKVPRRTRGLRELFDRLEVFRELRSEMPMQTASASHRSPVTSTRYLPMTAMGNQGSDLWCSG